jgi:sugar phosphate isomerase/epimerase
MKEDSPNQSPKKAGGGPLKPAQSITRRQALKAAAMFGSALAVIPAASVMGPEPAGPVTIGMATLGFDDLTNRQLADELAAAGVSLVQLMLSQSDSRYWSYNGRSDISALTPERCQAIAQSYRSAKIKIRSLSVYTNLIHPDATERKANFDYFEGMMKVAGSMGVDTLVTEAGHYQPEGQAPRVEYYLQEEVWRRMIGAGKQLAELAERYNVTVLFEPFYRGFLTTSKRTRLFLEEVGSPRIRALLDPANLLEVNDLQEMFQQLKPWIECIHAKDRKLHTDKGVPAGQGDLDYPLFVRLAATHVPKAPLILEYVGPKDYSDALAHLRRTITSAGLKYQ